MSPPPIEPLTIDVILRIAVFFLLLIVATIHVLADRYGWQLWPSKPKPIVRIGPTDLLPWRDDVSVLDAPAAFGYKVFTPVHDKVVGATALNSSVDIERRRAVLDDYLASYSGAGNRFADLVAEAVRDSAVGETVVSVLIDHSGSMRRMTGTDVGGEPAIGEHDADNGFSSAATLAAGIAQYLSEALGAAGIAIEILGFTTVDWRGGQTRRDWLDAGRPDYPGRLNDLRHIIYKAPDETVSAGRRSLGLMLDWSIFKENLDGEAVAWAYRRLASRREPHKILVVISDGAPVDDSSLSANDTSYLERHLRHVVRDIEHHSVVRLVAIGIGYGVGRYYTNSAQIDGADDFLVNGPERIVPLLFPSGRAPLSDAEPNPAKPV